MKHSADEAINLVLSGKPIHEVADQVTSEVPDTVNIMSTYPWQIRLESPTMLDDAKALLKSKNIPTGDDKKDILTFQHSAHRDNAYQALAAAGINIKPVYTDQPETK